MQRILIVKTSAFGDIVQCYPVLELLKQQFPHAAIDWVVEKPCIGLVAAHPLVDTTIAISTKSWRRAPFNRTTWQEISGFRQQLRKHTYDVAFDLQGNVKSGIILAQVKAKHKVGFGKKTVPEWPNLLFTRQRFDPPGSQNIRQDYLALVKSFLKLPSSNIPTSALLNISQQQQTNIKQLLEPAALSGRTPVMVCPGSAWQNKRLTDEVLKEFLASVQQEIKATYLFVWGSEAERQQAIQLQSSFPSSIVVEKMDLASLQNLMSTCAMVIAMDSLPLHLAGTANVPTFSVFGASSAAKYKPLGDQHCAVQGTCPYGRVFEKRCPILRSCATGACIRELSSRELYEKFLAWHKCDSSRICSRNGVNLEN